MQVIKRNTALVMTAASLAVGVSAMPAQAAVSYVYSGRATTPSGSNYCDFRLVTEDGRFKFHGPKKLTVLTRGSTYTCNVQIHAEPDDGRTLNYPDVPGTGETVYRFSYPMSFLRACQNGNPGACSPWLTYDSYTGIEA